jgi:hypothetical protein
MLAFRICCERWQSYRGVCQTRRHPENLLRKQLCPKVRDSYIQCIRKVFRPLDISHFVTLQPYQNGLKWLFSLNLHTVPHDDKAKTGFYTFLQMYMKKQKNNYISIQTLYSALCWSTIGSNYSLEFWVWHYKLGTPVFGECFPFFSADRVVMWLLMRSGFRLATLP